MDFFPEINVTAGQAEAIARGLFAVARADGEIHPGELLLIKGFYNEAVGGSPAQLSSLEKAIDIEPGLLAAALGRPELARLFLKTALLVCYSDSHYGDGEKALIGRYADTLEVPPEEVAGLEQSVKEYLVGHLAGLSNVEAAAEVSRKMGA